MTVHIGPPSRGSRRAPALPRRGFVPTEVVALLAICLIAAALLAVWNADARRRGMMSGSLNNLKRLGEGIAEFGLDHQDRVVSFDWRSGVAYQCGDISFGPAASELQAAANQAVCIIRRATGRTDLTPINAWFPHLLYWHLPLIEYWDESLPAALALSPGDSVRRAWQESARQSDPAAAYFALTRRPVGETPDQYRWAYGSSYEMPPCFYSPDASTPSIPTISQATTHNIFQLGPNSMPLGRRLLSEVRLPSNKAMVYERYQEFFGSREAFFLYPEARVPVLTADGSAAVRCTSQTNVGFQPNTPQSPLPSRFAYAPDPAWEAPTLSGATQDFVNGGMRWTRSGLRGRDFDGPEVPWVP